MSEGRIIMTFRRPPGFGTGTPPPWQEEAKPSAWNPVTILRVTPMFTVRVPGGGGNATCALDLLEATRAFVIDPALRGAFVDVQFPETESKVEVVRASLRNLGLKCSAGVTIAHICHRARELGLKPCLPCMTPYIRERFRDQSWCDCVLVCMLPIKGGRNGEDILGLDNRLGTLHLGFSGFALREYWFTYDHQYDFLFCVES